MLNRTLRAPTSALLGPFVGRSCDCECRLRLRAERIYGAMESTIGLKLFASAIIVLYVADRGRKASVAGTDSVNDEDDAAV
jgi:hypothetical protein